MNYSTGKLAFIFIAALLLSWFGAWLLARRYRLAVQALMRAPSEAPSLEQVVGPLAPGAVTLLDCAAPARSVSLAQNRRAAARLTLLYVGLSALMAASSAGLMLALEADPSLLSARRVAVVALVHAWPAIPAIGLLWRWPAWRVLGTLLGWCALCFAVMLWRSIEPQPMALLLFLALDVGAPLLLVALLCLGQTSRAAAPWLLPPLIGLVWASVAGIDLLAWFVERRSPWLFIFPSWFIPHGVMAVFALLPWLAAWWPLRWLGRALGRAYARQQLSEGLVLFTAVWAVALLTQALSAASSAGLAGAALLLPLGWIPLVLALWRWMPRGIGRPPTLLVLRVFQRIHSKERQVQALFDHVVERWRLTGNTVLIAGTDLVDRTLDAADIFTFLDGGLGQRFIHVPADVVLRLAAFDMAADAEGRFRVNECYCHDRTWQQALTALEASCDVVLMDLRGFQSHNAGCRFELGTLAAVQRLTRVVVLVDAQTDRACAEADAAGAPAGRFVWLDAARIDRVTRNAVLQALFAP